MSETAAMRSTEPKTQAARLVVISVLVLIGLGHSRSAEAQGVCQDADGDGFFDGAGCGTPVDCNDRNPHVFPAAPEICNGIDDNCDGHVDEGCQGLCTTPEHRAGDQRVLGSVGVDQRQPSIVLADDGYVVSWNQPAGLGSECTGEIHVSRVDASGNLRFGSTTVRAPGSAGRAPRDSHLAWTGSGVVVGFADAPMTDCTTPAYDRAYIEWLDPHMNPTSDPIQLSCDNGSATTLDVLWTGRQAVVLFGEGLAAPASVDGLYLARVASDGSVLDPCGVQFLSTVTPPGSGSLAWNGHEIAVIWSTGPPEGPQFNSEIYFQRFSDQLVPLDAQPLRLTFSNGLSDSPSLVWADGEWGLAWREEFVTGYQEIAFARLSAQGSVVSPPGIVQITTGANLPGGTNKDLPKLAWTGLEYGLFYVDNNNKLTPEGDVRAARVSSAGTHVLPDQLLTTDTKRDALFPEVVWNGHDHAIAWQDSATGSLQVVFGRMGCRCADADHDGFTTCAGNDCDDTRADVNPLRPEICGDGIDNNCNGLIDCQDAAVCSATGSVPGAVAGLVALADKQTWSWAVASGADRYDVAKGTLFDLRDEADARDAVCLASDVATTSVSDASQPLMGDGTFYLVRAQTGGPSACRLGAWGSSNDSAMRACP